MVLRIVPVLFLVLLVLPPPLLDATCAAGGALPSLGAPTPFAAPLRTAGEASAISDKSLANTFSDLLVSAPMTWHPCKKASVPDVASA